eukprot:TRINITY_DN82744_c0_g1_i1.p1 TRINITY_DN82744_c0_g1~~TRINITY_DN82744_c0_g1_i1.p1  ORF type:complete len:375 (+),score=64.99 TRINITY_DN82744_c0_g1_i1:67-1191(+)
MGVFGICSKFCMLLVVIIAVLVAYLSTYEHPLAPVFITIFKLQGLGRPMTEPVPQDMKPQKRPEGEMFLTLKSGAKMPANGVGMCCRPTAYDHESVKNTVLWYLLQGGRHIDTAAMYMNHKPIGEAIQEAIKIGIPRKEIFVVTKIPPDVFGYNYTLGKVPRMLEELGLDYLDVVLLHGPRNFHPGTLLNMKFGFEDDEYKNYECKTHRGCREATWKALSEFHKKGVIKDLGVSNFKINHMEELDALKLAPVAVNQVQYHPWAPDWQHDVVNYCHRNAIAVTAYFSLGGMQNKGKVFGVDVVTEIGAKHKKTAGQILLRWALEKNVSIIPGTGNPHHMKDNLGVYGFALSGDDMSKLTALSQHPIAQDFLFLDM